MMFEKLSGRIEQSEIPSAEKGLDRGDHNEVPKMSSLRGLLEKAFPCKMFEKSISPDQGGKVDSVSPEKQPVPKFTDLSVMKRELGKSYGEIKEEKPQNAPNIAKWFENGGSIGIEKKDGKQVWTYTDAEERSVSYVDGKVKFPKEARHPVIDDLNIGKFTGDRVEDKKLYLEKLEEEYGLTEIPDGYALHHDTENGNLQLVKMDYHKEFTHAGGHSMYKEAG